MQSINEYGNDMEFSILQQLNHSNNAGLKNVRKSLTAQFNFKERPLSWVHINNERNMKGYML